MSMARQEILVSKRLNHSFYHWSCLLETSQGPPTPPNVSTSQSQAPMQTTKLTLPVLVHAVMLTGLEQCLWKCYILKKEIKINLWAFRENIQSLTAPVFTFKETALVKTHMNDAWTNSFWPLNHFNVTDMNADVSVGFWDPSVKHIELKVRREAAKLVFVTKDCPNKTDSVVFTFFLWNENKQKNILVTVQFPAHSVPTTKGRTGS